MLTFIPGLSNLEKWVKFAKKETRVRKNVDKGNSKSQGGKSGGSPREQDRKDKDPFLTVHYHVNAISPKADTDPAPIAQALTVKTGNLTRSARHRILRVKGLGLCGKAAPSTRTTSSSRL